MCVEGGKSPCQSNTYFKRQRRGLRRVKAGSSRMMTLKWDKFHEIVEGWVDDKEGSWNSVGQTVVWKKTVCPDRPTIFLDKSVGKNFSESEHWLLIFLLYVVIWARISQNKESSRWPKSSQSQQLSCLETNDVSSQREFSWQ